MGRLIYIYLISLAFSVKAFALSQVSEEFSNYQQIAMDLHDLVVSDGAIPADHREWLLLQQLTDPNYSKGSNIMAMMNKLALVPGYPVISGLEGTGARDHNGSRLIAVSRNPVLIDDRAGRYVILQTFDPDSVWATWIAEEHILRIFKTLNEFDPVGEPLLFPEVEKRKEAERSAKEREDKLLKEMIKERETEKKERSWKRQGDGNVDVPERVSPKSWLVLVGSLIVQ